MTLVRRADGGRSSVTFVIQAVDFLSRREEIPLALRQVSVRRADRLPFFMAFIALRCEELWSRSRAKFTSHREGEPENTAKQLRSTDQGSPAGYPQNQRKTLPNPMPSSCHRNQAAPH